MSYAQPVVTIVFIVLFASKWYIVLYEKVLCVEVMYYFNKQIDF